MFNCVWTSQSTRSDESETEPSRWPAPGDTRPGYTTPVMTATCYGDKETAQGWERNQCGQTESRPEPRLRDWDQHITNKQGSLVWSFIQTTGLRQTLRCFHTTQDMWAGRAALSAPSKKCYDSAPADKELAWCWPVAQDQRDGTGHVPACLVLCTSISYRSDGRNYDGIWSSSSFGLSLLIHEKIHSKCFHFHPSRASPRISLCMRRLVWKRYYMLSSLVKPMPATFEGLWTSKMYNRKFDGLTGWRQTEVS